jgi:two-component system, LytTR family, response regulator
METRLAGAGFMRISRSTVISLSGIRELQPLGAGECCVILHRGARLDMMCGLRELLGRMGDVRERLEHIL